MRPRSDVTTEPDRGRVGDLTDKARENLERAREAFTRYYEEGADKARDLEDRVEARIQERPLRSLLWTAGIAVSVGVLLGTLFRR